MRDVQKRLVRLNPLLSFELLTPEQLARTVEAALEQSIRGLEQSADDAA